MKVDHRRFLGRSEERVLPYLGNNIVIAPDRALRVEGSVEPGWWRFSIQGRNAAALGRVEAPEALLGGLPAVVGHWSGARLAHGAAEAEAMSLLPEDELPRFAPCRARRWHSGDLLFDRLELEGEAEEAARRAFEDRAPIGGTKGIPGTLRAAFALAVVADVSGRTGVAAAPLEVRGEVGDIAEHGWPAAEAAIERLRREREANAARLRARVREASRPPASTTGPEDLTVRATEVLAGSGAALLEARRLADGLLVVTYRFLGERFRAVVLSDTLQVVDAGFCVSGQDRELTLASLPSVVREAVEVGHLVITEHV